MIVEDGSIVANADSLVTEAFYVAYLAARGATAGATLDAEESLIVGTDYILGKYRGRWKGAKVNSTQALDWPRVGVLDEDGYSVLSDAIPTRLKQAVCEAALLIGSGTDLTPTTTTAPVKRTRERVGPLEEETEYSVGTSNPRPTVTKIDDLVRGLVTSGSTGRLLRA